MKMPKAIIFDMDGVISDSEPLHNEAEKFTMLKYGVKISREQLQRYAGRSDKYMFSDLIGKYIIKSSYEKLYEIKENKLIELIKKRVKPTKGIIDLIDRLKKSLYLGEDPDILAGYNRVSEPLKSEWTNLIYGKADQVDLDLLDRLTVILEDHSLNLPNQEKSRKSLIHLKTLAQIMGQLEENTNMVLRQVLNGSGDNMVSSVLNGLV